MNKYLIAVLAAASATVAANADNDWLHIYDNSETPEVIFTTPIDRVQEINYTGTDGDTFTTIEITPVEGDVTSLPLSDIGRLHIGTNVPTLYITTDNGQIPWNKKDWWRGAVSMEGYGAFPDIELDSINIRGRGNSTMTFSKKPFRMKFDKKREFLGLKKSKNFALLANYIDNTLMRNAMAMKLGEMLGTPYVNHMVPVNIVFNGEYYGSFTVTEKLGINSGSIDDIDEAKGILWEIGADDETYVYHPAAYPNLPVAVKDPDFDDIAAEFEYFDVENYFNMWKRDLDETMNSISAGAQWGAESNWDDFIDLESFVNYMLVFDICCNRELRHPKSVFMHKAGIGQKYVFGPIWDFDWCFNFDEGAVVSPGKYLFLNQWEGGQYGGSGFFYAMCLNKKFQQRFNERWQEFYDTLYPQWLEYFDRYAALIEVTAHQNGGRWPASENSKNAGSSADFHKNAAEMRQWIIDRIEFINSDPKRGLFENGDLF